MRQTRINSRLLQIGTVLGLATIILAGCGSLTSKLEKHDPNDNRLGLKFADGTTHYSGMDTLKSSLPQYFEITDDTGNVLYAIEKDQRKDNDVSANFMLQGVEVTTTRKGIVERNGKVDLDFIITVPKTLIDDRWQLRVYPTAFKDNDETIEFQPVLLSGADFLRKQKQGYEEYQRFITSIIPDSLYWQEMLNHKGYNKAMSDLEAEYHAAWQKQLIQRDRWIDWENKINERYRLFNSKVDRNRGSVDANDWRLVLPSYWLYRNLEDDMIPKSFAEFAFGDKKIVKQKVTPEDSVRIQEKFWNYQRMAENERKKEEQEAMKDKLVKFPHIAARLDTIVDANNSWQYHYTQELTTDQYMKKVRLALFGEIVAIDQSRYEVPGSDTLLYNISAMVDFIDEAPRYMKEVVYRQVDKVEKLYIDFPVAKSVVDPSFANNAQELTKLDSLVQSIDFTGELVLDSITMKAYSSPEGGAKYNRSLSERRAQGLRDYLIKNKVFNDLKPSHVKAHSEGENWSGVQSWVLLNVYPEEVRDGILAFINNERDEDVREQKIRSSYPEVYKQLREEAYPSLRCVDFVLHTHRRDMVKDTIHTTVIDKKYNEGRELLRARDYRGALSILSDYPKDFNLAITYMSLGYDDEALPILINHEEKEGADIQYLLAILYYRKGEVEKSLKCLLNAGKLDRYKIFRAQLDPELNDLIKEYGLFKEELEF
ncbi:hypothetical protein [Porphyromonas somerae]|uniref:hypothetical protein n=1 Tax=Porphyromonas somerae TaxID=322095 RepID=UPI001FCB7411|nr:hypothetical protein [Porphyromonas somerae]BDE81989.1 hypothetical protein CE91St14_10170 [Porphyromonas somerae]